MKTVGPKGLAGSNPVCGAYTSVAQLEEYRSDTPVVEGSNPSARTLGV